ncbi:hypothetical protein [Bradyrhizobium betae]|uniref:Uncharacterized protein n=1 Tax=Bradyrhizobium betae TaxID=244734 RepID=A0A5P6PC13_9BRAD|nr:hypothetical protein [Bradyrhizobium betae]MCS3730025.1 hypothetical protein [Bradyrhizobium betae]QFI75786.1 hypothetical protein F8237_27340 [Bradyrhizobium betae]
MYLPSITDFLAIFALACAALAFPTILLRRSSHALFDGGILLAIGLLIAAGLPVLSRLPWAEFAQEASEQAVAALHFLEVTYVILTL